MSDGIPERRQELPLEITARQREVWEALQGLSRRGEAEKFPLDDWYLGALKNRRQQIQTAVTSIGPTAVSLYIDSWNNLCAR